jgi:CDK inhibitor PHO81
MVPALAETITELGLVLVADTSNEKGDPNNGTARGWSPMPDGINGILKDNGILRFHDTIDM